MEKVKVTREQAEAIEKIKDIDYAINIHSFKKRPDSPLVDMSTAKLARALFVGYEVEPEFKVGDWVKITFKLNGGYNSIRKITKVKKSCASGHDVCYELDGHGVYFDNEITHATPEEIQQEKERRWWAKIGRKPKEYRAGDIVLVPDDCAVIVKSMSSDCIYDEDNIDWFIDCVELVCPVENRLDVKRNV